MSGCGPSSGVLRLSDMRLPLSLTPRPKSWMISEPSPVPTFMSPMFDTRHECQPSTNFLAPISTLTVAPASLTRPNMDPPTASSSMTIPASALIASFLNLGVSPM